MSPCTTSIPCLSRLSAFSTGNTRARISSLRCCNSLIRCLPSKPVAPVISTFISELLLLFLQEKTLVLSPFVALFRDKIKEERRTYLIMDQKELQVKPENQEQQLQVRETAPHFRWPTSKPGPQATAPPPGQKPMPKRT